jgi:hypothetical protein
MNFTYNKRENIRHMVTHNTNINQAVRGTRVPHNSNKQTMIWGNATWTFLHTMAHKIKPDYFNKLIGEFLNIIVRICNTLPCPICKQHAVHYIKNVNFKTIQTKDDLKQMLFHFHNNVNNKKNIPLFSQSELDSKYETSNLIQSLNYFVANYRLRAFNIQTISNKTQRDSLIQHIKNWFNQNSQYFNA